MDLSSPIYITADYGRIGRVAWNNKSNDQMALLLDWAWGNIYWCKWSEWRQGWIPHRVAFLIQDEIAKLKYRLVKLVEASEA